MRRRLLVPIVAALAVACAGTAVLAGTTDPSSKAAPRKTHVEGSVTDREGSGVAGATVYVRPTDGAARTFELVTDERGHFHLDGVPPGTYWFIAFGAGLATGSSPALPIIDHLVVAIRLDDESHRV